MHSTSSDDNEPQRRTENGYMDLGGRWSVAKLKRKCEREFTQGWKYPTKYKMPEDGAE